MSLGLYGDIGTATCEGFPGLQAAGGTGGYDANAQQMAEWEIDAFKVDGSVLSTSLAALPSQRTSR
jgi:hypothetical protein